MNIGEERFLSIKAEIEKQSEKIESAIAKIKEILEENPEVEIRWLHTEATPPMRASKCTVNDAVRFIVNKALYREVGAPLGATDFIELYIYFMKRNKGEL